MDELQFDWIEASHSYLKVRRGSVSYPREVSHEISTWHHSLLPFEEDQELPASTTFVLQLRCSPQQDEEEHRVVLPAAVKSRNLTVTEIHKAIQALERFAGI